jgi:trehalose/maltose transport system permease protein
MAQLERSVAAEPQAPTLAPTRSEAFTRARNWSFGGIARRGLFWLLIAVILLYTLFPFYWAIVSSLTPGSRLFDTPVRYWPADVTFNNYKEVFGADFFVKALRNSIIVAGSTVLLALVIGSLAAYAMGRMHFRGRTFTLYLILSMTMFPQIAVLASMYRVIDTLNILNTWWALIVAYTTFTLPFTIWVLTNFFKAMPGELEEAALVDGASPLRAFWQILLPLALPGMVTTGLLAFIGAWNEYLFALTFTQDWGSKTVPLAITSFTGETQFELPWANRMAASVTITLPLVVAVLIFQRKIVAGLTGGAVKG